MPVKNSKINFEANSMIFKTSSIHGTIKDKYNHNQKNWIRSEPKK